MLEITNITNDPAQVQNLVLEDGTSIRFQIRFVQMQLHWVIEEMVYGDFVSRGITLVLSPNVLRKYKNILPFGLACFSEDGRDPQLLDDFSSGNCRLFILTSDEVQEYEDYLSDK